MEREQEEDGEDALPGWGCWGGAGIKINPKPKPKQSKKPKVSAVDSALSHVILNQKRDKKVTLCMACLFGLFLALSVNECSICPLCAKI